MAVKEKKRVQVQIDKELADNTEAVLSQLGLNPTTAINMFYKRGISTEELQNIFRRLYRVEGSRNMNTGGHGLGLYIAQELAHQLNGEIRVKSEYGIGSTFSLVLKTNN